MRLVGKQELKPNSGEEMFQFQIGAIGRTSPVNIIFPVTGFQFQIGAIGSGQPTHAICTDYWFQFQIGAIGSFSPIYLSNFLNVSIPDWCDW